MIYEGAAFEKYTTEKLHGYDAVGERKFVDRIREYIKAQTEKVLIVTGISIAGNRIGILQALKNLDAVYVIAQKEAGEPYIEFLKQTHKTYIVIDEFTRIENRRKLEYYIITAVENGKRIILTAQNSIALEFLNYGTLCHRVNVLHTSLMTYEEFLAICNKKHSNETRRQYLTEGGIFEETAIKDLKSVKLFVEEKLINSLVDFLGDKFSEQEVRILTYTALYDMLLLSLSEIAPSLAKTIISREDFLIEMGADFSIVLRNQDLRRVQDILVQMEFVHYREQYDADSDTVSYHYYYTVPAILCCLTKAVCKFDEVNDSILDFVEESIKMASALSLVYATE